MFRRIRSEFQCLEREVRIPMFGNIKVRIPMFGRIRSEFQGVERKGLNFNVWID